MGRSANFLVAAAIGVPILALAAPMPVFAAPVGGIYFNSPVLAKQADTIDAAVQGATTLKPYEDQLANLQAFALKEDLAIATLEVAKRDKELQVLLGMPSGTPRERKARSQELMMSACSRLISLNPYLAEGKQVANVDACIGQVKSSGGLDLEKIGSDLFIDLEDEQASQIRIAKGSARFHRLYPSLPVPSCGAIQEELVLPKVQEDRNAVGDLNNLNRDCGDKNAYDSKLTELGLAVDPKVSHAISDKILTGISANQYNAGLQPLQDQIDAVQKSIKTPGEAHKLTSILSDLNDALAQVDPILKLAQLDTIQVQVDQVEKGLACAAGCATPPTAAETIGTKTAAVVGEMNALASGLDIAAGRNDETNWLAAAQAIIAVYKADTEEVAKAKKAMAAIDASEQALAAVEFVLLSKTILAASGDIAQAGLAGCKPDQAFECALPAYIDSWNLARAQQAVLDWRESQIYAATIVRRQRLAAQAQRSILLAGTATLKAYGDGGIQPEVIAKFLQALGIVAIAAK